MAYYGNPTTQWHARRQTLPSHRLPPITKTAIKKAVDEPRDISMDLVHAQQARRALDYLLIYTSPLLWKKYAPAYQPAEYKAQQCV